MQRLKIALPDELRAQLDAASKKSGESVAEEIRRRVEASFAQEGLDKPSRDFLDALARMPAEIERETGSAWHKHAGAWQTFLEAIQDEINQKHPQGTMKFGARPHQTTARDNPKDLGTWIAMQLRLDHGYTTSERRRTYQDMFQKHGKGSRL